MTSSNGNIFRVTAHLCGEFTGEFLSQRPVTRSFDVFFDLQLNKQLSKQSSGWWFETLLRPLRRHCNANYLQWVPYSHVGQVTKVRPYYYVIFSRKWSQNQKINSTIKSTSYPNEVYSHTTPVKHVALWIKQYEYPYISPLFCEYNVYAAILKWISFFRLLFGWPPKRRRQRLG